MQFSLVGGFLILLLYFFFLSIYLFVISYQKKEWNKASFRELKERKKNILTNIASIDAIEQEGNLSPELSRSWRSYC